MRSTPLYKKIQFYCLNSAAFQLGALSNPTYANDCFFSFLNRFSFKDILPFFFLLSPAHSFLFRPIAARTYLVCTRRFCGFIIYFSVFIETSEQKAGKKENTSTHIHTTHTKKKPFLLLSFILFDLFFFLTGLHYIISLFFFMRVPAYGNAIHYYLLF